jgi:hypothetical protein
MNIPDINNLLFVLDGRSQSPRMDSRSLISETGSGLIPTVAAAYPPVVVSSQFSYLHEVVSPNQNVACTFFCL